MYKKIFTNLPSIGTLERIATNKVVNHIKKYNEDIFENESDVLNALEMAAEGYGIDFTKIYDFAELAENVVQKYRETIKKEEYKRILSLSKILETVKNINELRELIRKYDSQNLIAYLVYLLTIQEITQMQKNQILAITMIKPEYLCSAAFIAGYIK